MGELVREILSLEGVGAFHRLGEDIDAFHENVDILTESMERAHPFQREYLADQFAHCRIVDDIASPLAHGVVLMSIMADGTSLQALRLIAEETLGTRGRVHLL